MVGGHEGHCREHAVPQQCDESSACCERSGRSRQSETSSKKSVASFSSALVRSRAAPPTMSEIGPKSRPPLATELYAAGRLIGNKCFDENFEVCVLQPRKLRTPTRSACRSAPHTPLCTAHAAPRRRAAHAALHRAHRAAHAHAALRRIKLRTLTHRAHTPAVPRLQEQGREAERVPGAGRGRPQVRVRPVPGDRQEGAEGVRRARQVPRRLRPQDAGVQEDAARLRDGVL